MINSVRGSYEHFLNDEYFVFFRIVGSHEQCMRPSCWTQTLDVMSLYCNPNSQVVWKIKIDYNINNTIIEFVEK